MEPLDVKQTLFTNLLLLDFDPNSLEKKHRTISFNKDMFNLPNKTALEEVLHLLLSKLDPIGYHRDFRDCWPILDKKQEQQFKKVATTWLNNITKNEPGSHLPRLASLFTSPYGDKVYLYLLALSRFVLHRILNSKFNKKCFRDFIAYPSSSNNAQVNLKMMTALISKVKSKYVLRTKQMLDIQERWDNVIEMLVKSYREDIKILKEMKEKQDVEDPSTSTESLSSSNVFDEPTREKIKKVCSMISRFDNCLDRVTSKKEIFESVANGSVDECSLQGGSINVVIPDQFLKECEEEIIKKGATSVRINGDLNLLSVLKLWNISAKQCRRSLKQGGVPDLKNFGSKVACLLNKIRESSKEFSKLNCKMTEDIPDIQNSTQKLTEIVNDKITSKKNIKPLKLPAVYVSGLTLEKCPETQASETPLDLDIMGTEVAPEESSLEITKRVLMKVDEALLLKAGDIKDGDGDETHHDVNHEEEGQMEKLDEERDLQGPQTGTGINEDYFKSSTVKFPKGINAYKPEFKMPSSGNPKALRRSVIPRASGPMKAERSCNPGRNPPSTMSNQKDVDKAASHYNRTIPFSHSSNFKEDDGYLDMLAEEVVDQFLQVPTCASASSSNLIENLVKEAFSVSNHDNFDMPYSSKALPIYSSEEVHTSGNQNEDIMKPLEEMKFKSTRSSGNSFANVQSALLYSGANQNVPEKSDGPLFKLSDIFNGSPSRESLPFQGLEALQLRRMTASLAELAQARTPQLPSRLTKPRKYGGREHLDAELNGHISGPAQVISKLSTSASFKGAELHCPKEECSDDATSFLPAGAPSRISKQFIDLEMPKELQQENSCSEKVPSWDEINTFEKNNLDFACEEFSDLLQKNESLVSDPPSCGRRTSKRFQLRTDIFDMEPPFDPPKFDESLCTSGNNSLIDLEGFDDKNLLF